MGNFCCYRILALCWCFAGISFALMAEPKIMAVHNFNVSSQLEKMDVSGWWISEKMENELAQTGKFRIVTRARIARVLKERNISSGPSMQAEALGKIVGAQFIVTGQADFSGNKLILVANIIDVDRKAGEILDSYDLSLYASKDNIKVKLVDALKTLAQRMAMTPGEFLDGGLKMLNQGAYTPAVEAFRDLDRRIKIQNIDTLAAMVKQKKLNTAAIEKHIAGMSPGEALDLGIEHMNKGELDQAAMIFNVLQNSKMAKRIRDLMQLARDGEKKNEETLKNIIAEARRKYENAIISRNEKDRRKDPAALCDEAATALRAFLSNPGMFIGNDERSAIADLINEIEAFRNQLFAGPAAERGWTVPDVNMEFVPVSPGAFTVHSAVAVEDREGSYTVTITRPFWVGKYEVTAGQFMHYLKSQNGLDRNQRFAVDKEIAFDRESCPLTKTYSLKRGFDRNSPMTDVSWTGARNFCAWLTAVERAAGRLPEGYEYRLPTEAEWEYSCRSGSDKTFSFGDDAGKLGDYAWFRSNSSDKPGVRGEKKPNAWGLFDMHGNVWEWCNDWYVEKQLTVNVEDPLGPTASEGNTKVLKGGSYRSSVGDLMSSARYNFGYKQSRNNIGFRVVCAPEL